MTLLEVRARVLVPALGLLPEAARSDAALAMLVAIGWQESRFETRLQAGGGPARGFWQFEKGGVRAVLGDETARPLALAAWTRLGNRGVPSPAVAYGALAVEDLWAAVLARLLLWTLPEPLPGPEERERGWQQYLRAWRPGRPRPESWPEAWRLAWAV